MSLLEKVNAKATPRSVLRQSLTKGFFGAIIGLAMMAFDGRPRSDNWLIPFALWVVLCMVVGAVIEWQVPDDDPELIDAEPPDAMDSRQRPE